MKRHFHFAVPLVFSFVMVLAFTGCSNAQQQYNKGNYHGAIRTLDRIKIPSASDYILKAKSYIALDQKEKAYGSLVEYLMLGDTSSTDDRAFAVANFLDVNDSDNLTILLLQESDGLDAQMSLYRAYARMGEKDKAKEVLKALSASLDFTQFATLMLSTPVDCDYMLGVFTLWYGSMEEDELDDYLSLLNDFSGKVELTESVAKSFLALTDRLMENSYYTEDDIRLSVILKIKGNLLDVLYDKVNARIYWTQALKLNPDDLQLKNRLRND